MEDKSLVEEAVAYLKEKKEYDRILKALRVKYKKTGKLTGKITVEELSQEEALLLGPLDYNLYENRGGSFSIKKFMEYFCQGRFQGVDFLEVLKLYFGGEIKTKQERIDEENLLKDSFFQELLGKINREEVRLWLSAALEYKKYGYNSILRNYKENSKELEEIILNLDKGLDYVTPPCKDFIPLAKFSSIITRDSHYFDVDNTPGKLLLAALSFLYSMKAVRVEEINELLMKVGIIRDEVSNYTITYGLLAFDDKEEISGYKWFRRAKEPLILNVYNLNSIKELKAIKNKVFVFENPTVFCELMKKTSDIPVTLICTSGQLNLSSLLILDSLAESKAQIYYSGDFDPEGLQIADNLKYRYHDRLDFFGMNEENYLKIKGSISFHERLGKLNTVTSKELSTLVGVMQQHGTAGYQELLIDYYYEEIKRNLQ